MTIPVPATRPAARAFIAPDQTFDSIGGGITAIAFGHPERRRWWLAFGAAGGLLGILAASLGWLFYEGVGVWGNNIPVTWALDIVGYDWWIGVATGGFLTSAVFLLVGAEWRSAVNRVAETLALLATAAAAIYPIIHLGRPWFFFWNLPYPNTFLLWPQFRSPLYWDAVDIVSFLGTALTFWYIGLIPDLATLRDRAIGRIRPAPEGAGMRGLLRARLYGIAALGWHGSALHWMRWRQAYRLVALLGVVLVCSLQTGAAVMFAGSVEPGWHDTLLPLEFLIGALFQGVAFIAAMTVLLRAVFPLKTLITARHLEVMAVLLLVLGLLDLYCEAVELFTTALGGDAYETAALHHRLAGPHAWAFWTVVGAALLPVQLFWWGRARVSGVAVLAVGLLVSAGMFADHFMVIVVTLQHDFLPSSDHGYAPDLWGIATFVGSVGLFLALLLLALRTLPPLSIVETKRLAQRARGRVA